MATLNNVGRQFEIEFTECKIINGKEVYKCQHCDYKANVKSKLVTHNYSHTGQRPFNCSYHGCKSSFSRKEHLSTHFLIHLGKKPFICNLCGKAFRQKGLMYSHIRTHTGEKPYSCRVLDCDYSSRSSKDLAIHLRMHSGERPFKCGFRDCRFSSASSGNLKQHEKIHSGEKHYKCDFPDCHFSSARSNHVKVHKRIHSGEKPYKCDFEGCSYASHLSSAHVRRHKRIHTGEKPFRCDYEGCLFASARSCSLLKHKKNHSKVSAGDRDPKLCLLSVVVLSDVLNDSEALQVYATHPNLRNNSNQIYDDSICTDDTKAVTTLQINDKVSNGINNQANTSWPTEIRILEEHNSDLSTQLDDVDTNGEAIIQNSINSWTEDKEVQEIETADRKPKKQPRVCKLCSFKTKKLKKFLTHLQEHRKKDEFFCSLCDFVCFSKELLRSHWLSHHMDTEDSDGENDLGRDHELANINVNVNCSSNNSKSGCGSLLEVKEDSYFLETSSTSAKNSTCSHGNKSKDQKTGTGDSKLFGQESEVCANFIDRKQVYKHYTVTYYFSSVVHFSCHFCGKEFCKEMKVLNHLRHHTGQRLPIRAFSPQ